MQRKNPQKIRNISFINSYEDDIYIFSKTLDNFSQFVKLKLKEEMIKQISEGKYVTK
ncbi:MAG: hypothetical protein E6582_14335 [Clostridium sp.]|uniref:hypothetical protein n=1 Tax=Clostridium sp. TaxID=1506 RepID=UPI002914B857|nr:hypothetical protein [Clostridium sp.]MDU6364684.1 hypothetical protein [Clostridium sp.]